jgi:cyanophycinase-like exopeptidase
VDPEGPQCNDPLVRPSLEAATGIAITGGDQKRLCRQLNGTFTREVILERLQAGTPVFCTSASTVGLADRMIAGLADDDSVLVEEGLSILPGLTIETHVTQRDRYGRLVELCERRANPVILGLDENTALFFIPNTSRAVVRGPGHVFVLCCHDQRRSRVLSHGDSIDIADLVPEAQREWPDHNVLRFRARVADTFTRWSALANSR